MNTQSSTRKPGLAVVRCGDSSLHRLWAEETQLFDVAVSYFGHDADKIFPEARYVHRLKAGKWNGIYAFFAAYPELLHAYDYYWFPDDDLALDAKAADQLVKMGQEYQLDLFQPALDEKSYFTHLITLVQRENILRYTNFVEIMAPVMSQRLWAQACAGCAETRTGFGLDFLWPQMVADMRRDGSYGCAILDSITMEHTRPVGSVLKAVVASDGGRSGREEMAIVLESVRHRNPLFRSLKLAVPRKCIYASLRHNGRMVAGLKQAWQIAKSLLNIRNTVQPLQRWRILRLAITATL